MNAQNEQNEIKLLNNANSTRNNYSKDNLVCVTLHRV